MSKRTCTRGQVVGGGRALGRMSWRTAAVALALLAAGCSVPNQSHCGNQKGDATCAERDPKRPYCSLCEASNDGCVAEPVTVEACHRESDSGAPVSTTTTTGTPTSTGTPTTSTSEPDTSTSTTTSTSTSTSTTTSTSTSTSTTEWTTSTTADTSTSEDTSTTTEAAGDTTTTEAESTTIVGPYCGNNIAEAGETCDGTDLKGKDCASFPSAYGGGTLACNNKCDAFVFGGCCKVAGVMCSKGSDCCSGTCGILSKRCN
jgi:hypothetical protein